MEEERYEDVIDAYESGVGVKEGESLTDYIKRNNIKILDPQKKANGGIMRNFYAQGDEVEEFQEEDLDTIELMKDQGIPMGEQVRGSGYRHHANGRRRFRSSRRRISKIQIRYVRARFRAYGL